MQKRDALRVKNLPNYYCLDNDIERVIMIQLCEGLRKSDRPTFKHLQTCLINFIGTNRCNVLYLCLIPSFKVEVEFYDQCSI